MSFKIIFTIELYVKCNSIYIECIQIKYIYILTIILNFMFKIVFKE